MKKILLALILSLAFACVHHLKPSEIDGFRSEWYSRQLRALEEPSFLEFKHGKTEAYRFLWLRTFHHPISIRIEVQRNGNGRLFLKVCDGAGGYDPGELVIDRQVILSPVRVQRLRNAFAEESFYSLSPYEKVPKNVVRADGAQWYVEARANERVHWVDRWSPKGTQIWRLGLLFLELAEYSPEHVY